MSKKTALVIRCGAYGDMVIVSPVFKALRAAGYDNIICHTGKRGLEVLKFNPFIDKFIEYEFEGKENPDAEKHWDDLREKIKPDYFRNFAESIEVSISLHPRSAVYNYPKEERKERGGRNFYDVTAEFAGLPEMQRIPDLYFKKKEFKSALKYVKYGKFNILWSLSGSGAQKVYPWTDYVMGEVIKNFPDAHFITVGDEKCQILEGMIDVKNITNLSGKTTFRETMALTGLCDLIISPDTGVLHASGYFNTPKIGLLGHTSIENITRTFVNDYTLEADPELAECSPCYRLIYKHKIQCPIERLTGAAWCMAVGQPQQRLYDQIMGVINVRKGSQSIHEAVPAMRPA